ncbi:MAG: radical SAM protein [Armatimonadota bacterium]
MESRIDWIDSFVDSIKPHVTVRERDSLLILLPNQAYKINKTGLLLLKETLDGRPIREVIARRSAKMADDDAKMKDISDFFSDIRAMVMGCLGEGHDRIAVDVVPYQRPFNTLPVLSEIALTYRCNLSCRFCYAGCQCKKQPDCAEMSTDEVKRVLQIIKQDAEVPSVSWTGGEPTLRKDLVELTAYATALGIRVNLITNGTNLTEELVTALKDAGLRSAQVSLEGPNAEVHDRLTQLPGSFDRTVRGIELLKQSGLHVHTNTTVNRMNAAHLTELIAFVKSIGMKRLSMNMVIPCGSAPDEEVTISYTEMAGLMAGIQQAARDEGIEFMWYSPTPYCLFNPVASQLGGKSCAACDGLLSVSPTGDVLPCSSLPKSVGNLLRTPFNRVWEGRRARYWRDKRYAHKICKACAQFDICTGACPIYWQAMGYQELTSLQKRGEKHEQIA